VHSAVRLMYDGVDFARGGVEFYRVVEDIQVVGCYGQGETLSFSLRIIYLILDLEYMFVVKHGLHLASDFDLFFLWDQHELTTRKKMIQRVEVLHLLVFCRQKNSIRIHEPSSLDRTSTRFYLNYFVENSVLSIRGFRDSADQLKLRTALQAPVIFLKRGLLFEKERNHLPVVLLCSLIHVHSDLI